MPPQVFPAATWLRSLVLAGLVISVAGSIVLFSLRPGSWHWYLLLFLAALFAVGLVESFTSKVVLGEDTLLIRSNFRATTVPRSDIAAVRYERGSPVALELRSGKWIELPSHGGGPDPSTVRAWLKR
jgi:hypothetical protein